MGDPYAKLPPNGEVPEAQAVVYQPQPGQQQQGYQPYPQQQQGMQPYPQQPGMPMQQGYPQQGYPQQGQQGGNMMQQAQGMMGQFAQGMGIGGGYQAAQPMGGAYTAQAPKPNTGMMGAELPSAVDGSVPAADYNFLAGKKRFFIKQRFQAIEALANLVGFDAVEFSNKYDIFDADTGEPLLYAAEESNCCWRAICNPNHPLKLYVFDVSGGKQPQIMMNVDKPFACNLCVVSDICSSQQKATTPAGVLLGSAKQRIPCGGWFKPAIDMYDTTGNKGMTVTGPCCVIGGIFELCMDQQFDFVKKDGTPGGKIVHLKPEQGAMDMMQQAVSDSDKYLLELEEGLDAAGTANVLATMLLLDYLFFETGPAMGMENGQCVITCCNLYCFGCITPCKLGGGGEDAGGGFE